MLLYFKWFFFWIWAPCAGGGWGVWGGGGGAGLLRERGSCSCSPSRRERLLRGCTLHRTVNLSERRHRMTRWRYCEVTDAKYKVVWINLHSSCKTIFDLCRRLEVAQRWWILAVDHRTFTGFARLVDERDAAEAGSSRPSGFVTFSSGYAHLILILAAVQGLPCWHTLHWLRMTIIERVFFILDLLALCTVQNSKFPTREKVCLAEAVTE